MVNAKTFILSKFVVKDPDLARAVLRMSATQLAEELAGSTTTRCVRYGGKFLKWAGIVSGVLADLLTTTPARAATLEETYRLDPSHLFDHGVSAKAACKRLADDDVLRSRFMILADTMAAADAEDALAAQRKAYGDDLVCGGSNDSAAREAFVSDLVATGAYRRAAPEDFAAPKGGDASTERKVREALARGVGAVPAR
jgi:hypothetical protein